MDMQTFEANNQAYLMAGVTWVRAVLAHSAESPAGGAAPRRLWRRAATGPAASADAPAVASAREALDHCAALDPAPALVVLAQRLGLTAFESDVLLFALAMELDPGLPALVTRASPGQSTSYPTFGLAMALFHAPSWSALSPERPLRSLRLVELNQAGTQPLISAPLRIDERIAAYLKGLNYLDERLTALASVPRTVDTLPPSQARSADTLRRWLQAPATVRAAQITGSDPQSKRDVAAQAAREARSILLSIDIRQVPIAGEVADQFSRLWAREAALLPLALLIEGADEVARPLSDGETTDTLLPRLRTVIRSGVPVMILGRETIPGVAHGVVVPVEAPTGPERAALWHESLTAHAGVAPAERDVTRLANEFAISATRIHDLAATAATTAVAPDQAAAMAWEACIADTASALEGLASRVVATTTLADLQLPQLQRDQLERVVRHARHRVAAISDYGFADRGRRGLGLGILLYGESGSGKTTAAEAIANALSLALFRVDLSNLFSKYYGETMKQMCRIMDGAERGGVAILFDEAEGVFWKRQETGSASEHHATLDVDYLLTRIETFRGVAILATNMKHAMDPAFVRRLRYAISFSLPGLAERRAIWARAFPSHAALEPAELDRLARFPLSGAGIFNAAVAAAHDAAADDAEGKGAAISMPHVLNAVRWELRKLDKPTPEQDFAWPAHATNPASGAA
jgi:cytidylate kinase